jgi:hypothetical protein
MPDGGGSTNARVQHSADHGDTHATAGADEQDYGVNLAAAPPSGEYATLGAPVRRRQARPPPP